MKEILAVIFIVVSVSSCQQSGLEFSCDPVINEFVVKNREGLSKIAVQELATYDDPLQRAIFNSWDYQKKRSAWIDKLQYVLIHLTLTGPESAHIQKLIVSIGEDYFLEENIAKNQNIRAQFAVQWIDYSINELGWDNRFIAFMVYRLYTDPSQLDSELSSLKSIGAINNTNAESCNCNVSSDFCGGINCTAGGCILESGCGWLWSMPCDGLCY
ncbi:MAG: bacteriocin fulvocin C-related protein [Prolixibacteraceae bacterium]|nr:bacteriocin fulvocin C-related protein [Prolixibacteraceae bacterium]